MKRMKYPLLPFFVGALMILLVNAAVLAGVQANRKGAPTSSIIMTERELPGRLPLHEENSGLSLRLEWRIPSEEAGGFYYSHWESPAWLTEEKLRQLGFPLKTPPPGMEGENEKLPLPRKVLVVLEYNGPAYRKALAQAEKELLDAGNNLRNCRADEKKCQETYERTQKQLHREQNAASRLFAVDAGLDAVQLRAGYRDRMKYLIVPAIAKLRYDVVNEKPIPQGYIAEILVDRIHVDRRTGEILKPLLRKKTPDDSPFISPRYKVELAWGRHLEPWILSVKPMNSETE